MIKEIIMPRLGQTVEEATIQKWYKKEGDKVTKGEVLLEIMTDKAALEVESFHEGFLRKTLAKEGDTVPVLSVIGYIADSMDEEIPEVKGTQQKKETSASSKAFSCPLNVKKKKQ
jgi:dihydrolipoamide dehydrogenase